MKYLGFRLFGVPRHLLSRNAEPRPTERRENSVSSRVTRFTIGPIMHAAIDFDVEFFGLRRKIQTVSKSAVFVYYDVRSYFHLRSKSDFCKPLGEQEFFRADQSNGLPRSLSAPPAFQVRGKVRVFNCAGLFDALRRITTNDKSQASFRSVVARWVSADTTRQLFSSALCSSTGVPRGFTFLRFSLALRRTEAPTSPFRKTARSRFDDGVTACFTRLFHGRSLSQFLTGAVA